jgi:hypothetical protein
MGNYAQQVKASRRPAPVTFRLMPEHFADAWGGQRPVAGIELGLRVPSERDIHAANLEAEKAALQAAEGTEEMARAATRLYLVVSRAICSPHDVGSAHPYFELPEDEVPLALKSSTIKRLYDDVERLIVDGSPVYREASPDDLAELATRLMDEDAFNGVSDIAAAKARRYLLFALDLLNNDE